MSNVTKDDICHSIADQTGLTVTDIKITFEGFLSAIQSSLLDGRNVELRGFGRFKVKPRKARTARNPITGAAIPMPEGWKLVFQGSKELRNQINEGNKELVDTTPERIDTEIASAT